MPSEEEIKRITELHDQGFSQGEIAKQLGRSKSTINEWLHKILANETFANETERKREQTINATIAKRDYDLKRRIELSNLFFDKICQMMKDPDLKPGGVRDLAVSYGIIIDKRHLLEPPASGTPQGTAAICKFNELLENGASPVKPEAETEHPRSESAA